MDTYCLHGSPTFYCHTTLPLITHCHGLSKLYDVLRIHQLDDTVADSVRTVGEVSIVCLASLAADTGSPQLASCCHHALDCMGYARLMCRTISCIVYCSFNPLIAAPHRILNMVPPPVTKQTAEDTVLLEPCHLSSAYACACFH